MKQISDQLRKEYKRQYDLNDVIGITLFDTPEELVEFCYGGTFEDIKNEIHPLFDNNDRDIQVTVEQAVVHMKEHGCYGFTDCKGDVFVWVDRKVVNMNTLIALLSHERGHFIKPFKRDDSEDEFKAELYSLVATWAYQAADTILNTDLIDRLDAESAEELAKAGSITQ